MARKELPSLKGDTREEGVIAAVFAQATRGDPASVLAAMDAFCYSTAWMMNVGDVKGAILRRALLDAAIPPHGLVVEFGGYCGYSAIIEFAGLGDRVHVWVGDVPAVLPRVVATFGAGCVDALFIDHWKQFYLRDLHGVEAAGLLHPGSVIVADNIVYPGAPDYLAYVTGSPDYRTVVHESTLEYLPTERDAVAVSVRL